VRLARHVVLAFTAGLLAAVPATAQRPDAAEQQRQLEAEMAEPRPIDALNSVWIEELTWMEVRDALREGKTTAIVSTGGIEQNGPYLATGKHNYVLDLACEGIARALGDALCAPIIKLVPEGAHDPPSGHMRYPGTLSLRPETFEAVLTDVGRSLAAHGFEHVVYIGDSGGNQRSMAAVAESLDAEWTDARAHYVPEFYRYAEVFEFMESELGIVEPTNDGLHDDFVITSIMMGLDPETVRFDQRVAAGKASINGLSLEPLERTVEIGRKLLQFRVDRTVEAIRAAREGTAPGPAF
jgi:creatinine amidohydrolase/Fe(II)-dependent formamide hydrolase-like protein